MNKYRLLGHQKRADLLARGQGWSQTVGALLREKGDALLCGCPHKVLLRFNEQRNILHERRKRKAMWIGHILRRNCLLKQVIEGKVKGEMEVTRRRRKLLDDLNL